ncbi:hypothetical protein CTRI78_v004699 [Colletotrichum trifolii]|uniref:Uncharacterized protein n=1 Tax=Colletotrichum trifolii TaxID=5466 RepID=A0A4R8RT74_COLTR|nr:hypothetical protein CTRI78_v004699 [Colletotrichum trifolii]
MYAVRNVGAEGTAVSSLVHSPRRPEARPTGSHEGSTVILISTPIPRRLVKLHTTACHPAQQSQREATQRGDAQRSATQHQHCPSVRVPSHMHTTMRRGRLSDLHLGRTLFARPC